MATLNLIISTTVNPYINIASEKYLMDNPFDGVTLMLWSNDKTVVIGKHQNIFDEVNLTKLYNDGGVVARRYSGGGAVYHDVNNLNFTFVASKEQFDKNLDFDIIINALKSFGLQANLNGRNDMVIDGRKFSGNAYYNTADYCLHHGTILINTDINKMQEYLNVSEKKLQSHFVSSVKSRVVNLCQLDSSISKDKVINAIMLSAKDYFDDIHTIDFNSIDREYVKRQSDFLQTTGWLNNNGSYRNIETMSNNSVNAKVCYDIVDDKVVKFAIFTDSLNVNEIDRIQNEIIGQSVTNLKGMVFDQNPQNKSYVETFSQVIRLITK